MLPLHLGKLLAVLLADPLSFKLSQDTTFPLDPQVLEFRSFSDISLFHKLNSVIFATVLPVMYVSLPKIFKISFVEGASVHSIEVGSQYSVTHAEYKLCTPMSKELQQ